mmetsp:Transcript_85400/g.227715  ORF Transcript_85400/g.227715 Transcript_85400/m.227715 type:complete len:103 (+) Transcript_85400:521-829(+)
MLKTGLGFLSRIRTEYKQKNVSGTTWRSYSSQMRILSTMTGRSGDLYDSISGHSVSWNLAPYSSTPRFFAFILRRKHGRNGGGGGRGRRDLADKRRNVRVGA